MTKQYASAPISGLVLWMRYNPSPVAAASTHSFLVESAKTSSVDQDITSSVVKIVAGTSAGLRLVDATGVHLCRVPHGALGVLSPGMRTSVTQTDMSKQAGTMSRSERVETRISFQAVTTPGHLLPAGAGAIIHKHAIPVAIA